MWSRLTLVVLLHSLLGVCEKEAIVATRLIKASQSAFSECEGAATLCTFVDTISVYSWGGERRTKQELLSSEF